MPGLDKPTVLISELSAMSSQRAYLPYVWGLLRSHVEHHSPETFAAVEWLPPLFGSREPARALEQAGGRRVDLLGLSCYTWNWDPQLSLARAAKAANPDCLVVAGGPQPDVASPDFFERHPYIDAVVVNDGEVPFGMIVEQLAGGRLALDQVPGVAVPGPDGSPTMALDPVRPTDFSHSPFVEYAETYERILHETPGLSMVLETNRGCPYKCSFCDWGSNTMSKIRTFDMERVRAEAAWAFRQPLFMIMLTDANFGILARDLEIAQLYAELFRARPQDGPPPAFFYYNPAKNHPKRTTEIAKIFVHAGLSANHPVAVQHTDPEVLAATDRANISIEKQHEVVRELTRDKVPLSAQLILGIPGDTVDKWEQVFADLMEWGVHDCWVVSDYALLPNAPAADPAFRARWAYETVRRPTAAHGRSRPKGNRRGVCSMDLIVACRTFSRQDWVGMRTYSAIVTGLHNTGFTRRIAQYMRFCHDVPYRRFYDELIHGFVGKHFESGAWWRTIADNLTAFLADADASDALDAAELPELGLDLRHDDWFLLQVALHRDVFFDALREFLDMVYPVAACLPSVLEYQRQLVITPDYDPARGRQFESEYAWTRFFEELDGLVQFEPRPEPARADPNTVFDIRDAATGVRRQQPLNWAEIVDERARIVEWARCMVRMDRSSPSQCFDLPPRVPRPGPGLVALRTAPSTAG